MLNKMNLGRRLTFYCGVLVFIAGVQILPPSAVTKEIFDGAISFVYIVLVTLPFTYLFARFLPPQRKSLGFPTALLPIVVALSGGIAVLAGLLTRVNGLIEWGTFLFLLGGELRMIVPFGSAATVHQS